MGLVILSWENDWVDVLQHESRGDVDLSVGIRGLRQQTSGCGLKKNRRRHPGLLNEWNSRKETIKRMECKERKAVEQKPESDEKKKVRVCDR